MEGGRNAMGVSKEWKHVMNISFIFTNQGHCKKKNNINSNKKTALLITMNCPSLNQN